MKKLHKSIISEGGGWETDERGAGPQAEVGSGMSSAPRDKQPLSLLSQDPAPGYRPGGPSLLTLGLPNYHTVCFLLLEQA